MTTVQLTTADRLSACRANIELLKEQEAELKLQLKAERANKIAVKKTSKEQRLAERARIAQEKADAKVAKAAAVEAKRAARVKKLEEKLAAEKAKLNLVGVAKARANRKPSAVTIITGAALNEA